MASAKLAIGASTAVFLGCCSATAAATYVETTIPSSTFSLTAERFDISTYAGRYAKMLSNGDPATLIKSNSQVLEASALLKNFEQRQVMNSQHALQLNSAETDELWRARKLVQSAVHPDTGEIVPQPFRMSGYVPFNAPVCAGMMLFTSTPALLFGHWVNQSQNALVNYFNRNASSPSSTPVLIKSYLGAVGSAMTVALGLSAAINKFSSPARAVKLLRFVAFPASMIASSLNCYIMRRPEIATGVGLIDSEGNPICEGKLSSKAAEKAVMETVASRSMLQVPVFLGPVLIMSLPPIAKMCAKSPVVQIPLMTLITMVCFSYGLPGAVAVFPQIGSIAKENVEEEFREFIKEDVAYYNKGL